jgi:hypothetical protein
VRIITDFDGVITAQDAEADAVGERLLERATEALGGDAVRAHAIVAGLRAEVRANPAAHGWFVGDAIGCYADEDPYAFHNAVARAIYTIPGGAELAGRFRELGFATEVDLAIACFEEGTRRYRATHPPHVLEEALGAIQTFFAAGAEVVIVSNSSTERIQALLEPSKILRWGTGKIRVRGDARKFQPTGDRPRALPEHEDFGGRRVLLRRGWYYDILNDERPDVVIGDVLSLDIALPAALRAHVADFDEMDVVLKRHPRTPRWALDACAARGIATVDSIAKLPELLRV